MSAEIVPVVIIGAGPTGISAATLLARYGVPSVVLERWDGIYPQPRAVHVDGEVRRILARMGVEEEFARITVPMALARFVDRDMKLLTEIRRQPVGRNGYPDANMLDQPQFEDLLRRNAAKYPGIDLRGEIEVQQIAQETECVRVDFLDHATGTSDSITARYVLGCDGANSMVRASIGATMRDLRFDQRWLVVDVASAADLPAHGIGRCDPSRAGIYIKNAENRYRWEFRLADDESAEDYRDVLRLQPLIQPWLEDADVADLELVRVAEYTFRAQFADRWRDRRVFILGDAAHLTPPFIGQGMCAGIRDAANLAWKLAGVLSADLPETVLDSYEVERRPHVRAMIRLARLLGQALTSGGELGDVLRHLVMPHLHRVPGVEQMIASGETPPLKRSALIRQTPLPGRLVGKLAPNVLVDRDRRLDDLVQGRFALATRSLPSDAQAKLVASRGAMLQVAIPGDDLDQWLRSGRATAALIRPDGTVARAGRDLDTVIGSLPQFNVAASVAAVQVTETS